MSVDTNTQVQNDESAETTTFQIEDYFENATYSPYGVIKVVNRILADLGIEKELPGPMGYTYCKKGYIRTSDAAKKVVPSDAAIEWTSKYLAKLTVKLQTTVVESEEVPEMTEPMF
jgi:hypothetical protein